MGRRSMALATLRHISVRPVVASPPTLASTVLVAPIKGCGAVGIWDTTAAASTRLAAAPPQPRATLKAGATSKDTAPAPTIARTAPREPVHRERPIASDAVTKAQAHSLLRRASAITPIASAAMGARYRPTCRT